MTGSPGKKRGEEKTRLEPVERLIDFLASRKRNERASRCISIILNIPFRLSSSSHASVIIPVCVKSL